MKTKEPSLNNIEITSPTGYTYQAGRYSTKETFNEGGKSTAKVSTKSESGNPFQTSLSL